MYKVVKRILDIVLSLLGLIILSPLLLVLWIMFRVKVGSPAIFVQERPGLHGKVFKMYKFRSMNENKDENGNLLPPDERLTPFGKKMRSTSLDELPELVNILKGDMSIVGPRPLLVKYLPLYNEEQSHRHDVRPGLTGLAQVMGRNSITWDERFKLDVEYVNNMSFGLDVKIFFKTFEVVFKKEGISSATSETMEEFKGNE
jgi:lipopolysaccharide/colanic/teichoic acid biosynthesis glycosyltransferase